MTRRKAIWLLPLVVFLHHLEEGSGHAQHVRHTPPWQSRPWVLTPEGRGSRIGTPLPCRQCDDAEMDCEH